MFKNFISRRKNKVSDSREIPFSGPLHAGICVGGTDWPYAELSGRNKERRITFLEDLGETEANCVNRCGGDYLRTLYMTSTFLGEAFHSALYGIDRPVNEMSKEQLIGRLRWIHQELDRGIERIGKDDLEWELTDAFLRGVDRCNSKLPEGDVPIKVLLCMVEFPPRPIIEMAPPQYLDDFPLTANQLWQKFLKVHIHLTRKIFKRYMGEGRAHCIGAIEVINEPDYHWIPDETRIEKALKPDVYPINKYLTELHLPQIPETEETSTPYFWEPDGYYREQIFDSSLFPAQQKKKTPLLQFDWGVKLDRYIACAADLMEHVAFAAKDESAKAGSVLKLVSGAVTHNNVDYLARLYRANPNVYTYMDSIGIHPYHWPQHNMHDKDFLSSKPMNDWQAQSPRTFARDYFKRFDFLEEISSLTKLDDQEKSFGMSGKTLWITEFGIPTKKAAHANASHAHNRNLFIYRRGEHVPETVHAIVWEDEWDNFLSKVNRDYLVKHRVETVLYYTMRAGGMGESTDEEHSNFTLFDLDCRTTRLHPKTFTKFCERLTELTGKSADPEFFQHAGTHKPTNWTEVDIERLPSAPGTQSEAVLKYLHWVCANDFKSTGRVVEIGSFIGRSTLALATGLSTSGRMHAKLETYGSHEWNQTNLNAFKDEALANISDAQRVSLPPLALSPQAGRSCRDLLEMYLRPAKDFVETKTVGSSLPSVEEIPIEILYIAEVNDALNWEGIKTDFLCNLMPNGILILASDLLNLPAVSVDLQQFAENGLLIPKELPDELGIQVFQKNQAQL